MSQPIWDFTWPKPYQCEWDLTKHSDLFDSRTWELTDWSREPHNWVEIEKKNHTSTTWNTFGTNWIRWLIKLPPVHWSKTGHSWPSQRNDYFPCTTPSLLEKRNGPGTVQVQSTDFDPTGITLGFPSIGSRSTLGLLPSHLSTFLLESINTSFSVYVTSIT